MIQPTIKNQKINITRTLGIAGLGLRSSKLTVRMFINKNTKN